VKEKRTLHWKEKKGNEKYAGESPTRGTNSQP
jgi:hypothetical protein